MTGIKLQYFNHRLRGEPIRLLLAYGGLQFEDSRISLPWEDSKPWLDLKPSMTWGQLPCLTWSTGDRIFQSMAICRFIAREVGLAGDTSLEMAQVDEVIDALQDAINSNVSLTLSVQWYDNVSSTDSVQWYDNVSTMV